MWVCSSKEAPSQLVGTRCTAFASSNPQKISQNHRRCRCGCGAVRNTSIVTTSAALIRPFWACRSTTGPTTATPTTLISIELLEFPSRDFLLASILIPAKIPSTLTAPGASPCFHLSNPPASWFLTDSRARGSTTTSSGSRSRTPNARRARPKSTQPAATRAPQQPQQIRRPMSAPPPWGRGNANSATECRRRILWSRVRRTRECLVGKNAGCRPAGGLAAGRLVRVGAEGTRSCGWGHNRSRSRSGHRANTPLRSL